MQFNIKSLIFFIIQCCLFRPTSAGAKWHILTWDLKLLFFKASSESCSFLLSLRWFHVITQGQNLPRLLTSVKASLHEQSDWTGAPWGEEWLQNQPHPSPITQIFLLLWVSCWVLQGCPVIVQKFGDRKTKQETELSTLTTAGPAGIWSDTSRDPDPT